MTIFTLRRALIVALLAGFVAACGGGRGQPADPPVGGLTVVAGDGQVTVSWTASPGVQYWLFYAPAATLSKDSLSTTSGLKVAMNVSSPLVLSGLSNGTTYAFIMDGRYDDGPGGPATPSVSAVPRPAGTTWTAGGAMGSGDMHAVAYGGASSTSPLYVAVGSDGGTGGAIYQGTDGVNWTLVSTGALSNLNATSYALGKYLALGDGGSAYYSSDALTWAAASSGTTQNLRALASNGSLLVAVGDAGTILSSADGVSWTPAASVPTGNALYGVTYASSGRWLAVGAAGTLLTSSDGSHWNALTSGTGVDLHGVGYKAATLASAAAYVATGLGGVVLSSADAASWTAQTLSPAADLRAVVPTASQFLAVGSGGAVFTSPDGTNWTAQTSGTTNVLYGLLNAQAQYVAVGQAGVNIYSR